MVSQEEGVESSNIANQSKVISGKIRIESDRNHMMTKPSPSLKNKLDFSSQSSQKSMKNGIISVTKTRKRKPSCWKTVFCCHKTSKKANKDIYQEHEVSDLERIDKIRKVDFEEGKQNFKI